VLKNAGLSTEALESMGWPFEDLEALVLTLNNEKALRSILREHRLMDDYDEEKQASEMRQRIKNVEPPLPPPPPHGVLALTGPTK
jgi:phosphopantetheine adenylyltransferase